MYKNRWAHFLLRNYRLYQNHLDLSVTSRLLDVLRAGSSAGSGNALSLHASQDAGVRAREGTRGAVNVGLAVAAHGGLAGSTVGTDGEDLAGETSLSRGLDVLEHVALSDDLSAGVGLERVLRVLVEVVVDGVEKGVTSNLGRAAGGVVDVVALEGDHVVAAGEVHAPVVVGVAGSGPGGGTVDLVVGDGNTAGSAVAEDNVLAGDEVGGDVVNPDHVGTVNGDGITTPDVLRVDLSETDVLDDNVLDVASHADTLALNNTLAALTNQRLVGLDSDSEYTSLVVGDAANLGGAGLVVVAPSILVDGNLATGAGTPWTATGGGSLTLGTSEVEGLGQDDDTRGGIAEVADELRGAFWVDRCGVATTSYTCEVLVQIGGEHSVVCLPFAKPSAVPLTASAALTLEAKAATTAAKSEYFMMESYEVKDKEWIANAVC
jgi:hypothetical protein